MVEREVSERIDSESGIKNRIQSREGGIEVEDGVGSIWCGFDFHIVVHIQLMERISFPQRKMILANYWTWLDSRNGKSWYYSVGTL